MTKLQAHRGVSTEYPENTMVAYNAAKEQGYAAIELDPKYTADGVIVLHHDMSVKRTGRTADGEQIDVPVSELTLAQLMEMDFGIFKGEEFKGTKIPTLAELLEFAKENPQIHIKFDNVWEKFPDEIKRSFLSQLAACKGAYLGISCANLDCIKMAVEMVEGITIHYDDINIEDERLETLTQICKGHELYIWLLGKTVKPKWFKGERATLEMCLQAKKYAKLGIWVLATEEELDVAVNVFGADLVETNGQLKPAMVEAISKSK